VRTLLLIHRYLGIGLGVLMALWCLSGIVMIYVPYPSLAEDERVAALPSINWTHCCDTDGAAALADDTPVASFQLEMLGDEPVLRLGLTDGSVRLLSPRDGHALKGIGHDEAMAAAAQFGRSRGHSMRDAEYVVLDHDQWTVGGFRADRPLHRVAFNDPDGTEVYVSSRTGTIVQATTSYQRFWGWIGAVPHWLYPSILRQYPRAWSEVVIWTSLLGTFLTVTGLWIGIRQLGRRRGGGALSSPYRGVMFLHHVPGLVFGCFALTWVLSGLLSMNPWGLLESDGFGADREHLQGDLPTLAQVRSLLDAVPRNSPEDVVSVRSSVFDGQLFAISTGLDGSRQRFTANGTPALLTDGDFRRAAQRLTGDERAARWTLLTQDDTYHYSVGNERAVFPAVRISAGTPSSTLYYIDAITGELVDRADGSTRAFRWWHSALHRWDISAPLRTLWGRTLFMLPLLIGAGFVCVIGAYLGVKRATR
jgi:hypothetical protein